MLRKIRQMLFLLAAGPLAAVAFAQGALPRAELAAGFHRIVAEVAATPPARAQGLMNRRQLGANEGMIFVFPQTATHCFWMKNTPLPLSIAFLDEGGRIVDIAEMAPLSEENLCPGAPARFALEMNAGWFAARGIRPGAVIGGVDRLPAGR
ncbi:MAG: DUF192 domain-containing protein [Azospira sp.]|jgi:uncharacterized membrane protein (UPF0127 family)|nr:DUF192 domain-containing protein [Azospira sp.]